MIKINRIVSLLLALSLLGALLAGCAGSSADRCVKVEGDTISIPSMRISFSFPAPWFVVTDEELDAISQNKDLLNDYVDVEGNPGSFPSGNLYCRASAFAQRQNLGNLPHFRQRGSERIQFGKLCLFPV